MKKLYQTTNQITKQRHLQQPRRFMMLLFLLFVTGIVSPHSSIANKLMIQSTQEVIVKGNVKGDDGESLPGVNIMEKGTITGTVSDINGDFQLAVSSSEAVLVFSFVGYLQEEIAVGEKTHIDVVLYPDIMALGEVVVVGYGTQKR